MFRAQFSAILADFILALLVSLLISSGATYVPNAIGWEIMKYYALVADAVAD